MDTAALATVTSAWASIYPLTQQVADLSGQVTTRTKPTTKSVDISSDVLFTVDSSTLVDQGDRDLQSAAAGTATPPSDLLAYDPAEVALATSSTFLGNHASAKLSIALST